MAYSRDSPREPARLIDRSLAVLTHGPHEKTVGVAWRDQDGKALKNGPSNDSASTKATENGADARASGFRVRCGIVGDVSSHGFRWEPRIQRCGSWSSTQRRRIAKTAVRHLNS